MLGDDIHGDFGQIHVGADAGSGGDAGFIENFAHDGSRHGMRPHTQRAQVWRDVDEHLVNRVDMDVLGCGVFEVDAIYLPADLQIVRHARLGDDHRGFESRRAFQVAHIAGLPD